MKLLILDFLRRWWWLFAIAALMSAATAVEGTALVFAPAAVIALLLDAQRGVFRAVRPMPVSRSDQAKAWWIAGVPLLPLICLPVLAIGVLIFQTIHPQPAPAHAPWFAAGVQMWVALGYAGFCFFLMQWAPTRHAENLAENVQQGTFGALWGLSIPGAVFLLPNLPKTPAAIAPWHVVVFVAVPIFVALSYFSAADVVQRRMFATAVKARPQADSQAGAANTGLIGVPLYVANFVGRVVMFVGLIACVQIMVLSWMSHGNAPTDNPQIGMQVSLMGMMMGAVLAESVGMRALRVLPLSTPRLALLLSLIPWAGAFTSAVFSAVWCRSGDPALSVWMNLVAQSLALCGWATLAFAITMHIASSGRLFLLMLLVMIPGVSLPFAAKYAALFAAVGAVAGVAGFALLVRGLRKSSAFYRPRGFFGMTPGQPSAVR